jgi:2-polyprenyl-6-methoxyphenol hydroxylase-like FAD-dependent oxidoreductase
VVLVGDAAHASSPMMGQGGCMAMEDACVLAEELCAAVTVESALASYVNRRKPRAKWVQQQSRHWQKFSLGHRGSAMPRCANAAVS